VVTSPARREVARTFRAEFSLSERRSAPLARAHRSTVRYQSRRRTDPRILHRLLELAALRPTNGCDLLWLQLRREGFPVNRKRILRLYRLERLSLRKKPRRKLVAAVQRSREERLTEPNQRWSMDFIHDSLSTGRSFRFLNALDEFHRACLATEVDLSLPGERVVRVLGRLTEEQGKPKEIWVDNGPEFASRALDRLAAERGVDLRFIRPGKPVQNCFIESFNGTFRRDCLEANWFDSLADARRRIEAWRNEYNQETSRTHALGARAGGVCSPLQAPTAPGGLQLRRAWFSESIQRGPTLDSDR